MATGRHCKPTRRALARSGKHRRPSRVAPRAAVLTAVPMLLLGGTGAYAYWSASGSGAATVGTTTAAAIGVSASATPPPGLYPGRTVDLVVALSNSNGYPVSLTKLTAVTVTSSDPTGCPSSNITLPAAVSSGLSSGGFTLQPPFSVPASGAGTGTLAGLITLGTSAPDACQGKTFTVDLSFTGSQV